MATSHEEAGNILAQQVITCAKQQPGAVSVIADDTDVFVLLLHHCQNEGLASTMFMTAVQQRSTIDIKATVEKHHAIVPGLLAAYALSGCKTVPTYFGISKSTVLKILNAVSDSLTILGSLNPPLSEVVHQSTKFIASCYSRIAGNDMSGRPSLVTQRAQLLQSSRFLYQAKRSQRTLIKPTFILAS